MNTDSYHGTDIDCANSIATSGVKVQFGGGELGQGFYSGEHYYVARAWAHNKSKAAKKVPVVIKLVANETELYSLDIALLSRCEALIFRADIKQLRQQRSYIFGKDLIWTYIVGTHKDRGEQYKWESLNSETFLNTKMKIETMR